MDTPHEGHMPEDIESTSLPTHVALCNERQRVMNDRLENFEKLLEGIREDIKKRFDRLIFGVLTLLVTITGTLIYRFVILQHIH